MSALTGYRFGEFTVSRNGLSRSNTRIALEPIPLALLLLLIDHRDRIVGRTEILSTLWAGTNVTANSLHQAVARLRSVLGDDPDSTRYIETVPRIGYRFVGTVHEVPVEAYRAGPNEVSFGDDRSIFIRDVTIPDGSVLEVNQQVTKSWELQNGGLVPWSNRFLQRQGPHEAKGRLRSPVRVPIPTTLPGESCIISVDLVAPAAPGSCYAEWKMVDEHGAFCFPGPTSVYVSVDVVPKRLRHSQPSNEPS